MLFHSALGLSHALGHKLGAAYGIPHGITSVGAQSPEPDMIPHPRILLAVLDPRCDRPPEGADRLRGRQRMAIRRALLSPSTLHRLRRRRYHEARFPHRRVRRALRFRARLCVDAVVFWLVVGLGLKSDLDQYKVPREDVPKIAEKALGGQTEIFGDVVQLLNGLYP